MTQNRYWPDWEYDLAEKLEKLGPVLDEYHLLKVPLLGQHYEGSARDWCGRTSATMAFNYYQAIQGGDFKSRFITHWNADKPGYYVDLRYPGGQRAFHTKPTDPPHDRNVDKTYAVTNPAHVVANIDAVRIPEKFDEQGGFIDFSASRILDFAYAKILPANEENRKSLAAQIANDPVRIESRLKTMLDSLTANNPVILYSGFSEKTGSPIHLILIVGYAYLTDSTGRHLWLMVADPSTQNSKIKVGMFFPPTTKMSSDDLEGVGALNGKHDLIRLIPGDSSCAKASLVLLRARKLFEENTHSTIRDDLWMDYYNESHKGGAFIYSHRSTTVPPEFVFSNVARAVAYPFDGQKERFRPVNCFALTEKAAAGRFPMGSFRNLHSGVHLESPLFALTGSTGQQAPAPQPPPAQKPQAQKGSGQKTPAQKAPAQKAPAVVKEVRCLAPGYIVAIRLANAYRPPEDAKAAKPATGTSTTQDVTANELAQELAGAHNSFVLVRHDVEEVVPKQKEGEPPAQGKRFTFYSLYMHLAPPDWGTSPSEQSTSYEGVTWHKTLARLHGSLSVLDPQHEAFRQVRWLQKDPPEGGTKELLVMKGGAFSMMGKGAGTSVPFALGKEEDGLLRGVWKKSDDELKKIQDALIQGEMVTFCQPYLQVRTGELLGYVDGTREGFLHWEILAPSEPGQLQQFLEFATEKLSLEKDFFKFFEEKDSQNNYFDPIGEGELASLVEMAPVSKHAGDPERNLLKSFKGSYHVALLRLLLESHRALPFSKDDTPPKDTAPKKEPGYLTKVLVENYKGSLPAGPYKLKFTFEPADCGEELIDYDGRAESVTVRVPARARKIYVEPHVVAGKHEGFFIQPGGGAGKDALQKDVEHFKNLASMRWRNVVLRHLNDWSVEGIKAQMSARLKADKELPIGYGVVVYADKQKEADDAILQYAESVAWWAHKEKAFLGPNGEKSLFDGAQLPKETFLDNPHPVTFAWLLGLLNKHGFVRFADVPRWRSDEMKKVAALGWLPARTESPPRQVGELVYAGAVQRGDGNEPVVLQVRHEDLTRDLARGTFSEGVFAHPVEFPGWGRWELLKPEGAVEIGGLVLEGLTPCLQYAPEPPGQDGKQSAETSEGPVLGPNGVLSWRIPFRENCPKLLRGWLLARTSKSKVSAAAPGNAPPAEQGSEPAPSFQVVEWVIPLEAREQLAVNEDVGFAFAEGFIKRGNVAKDDKTYLTEHFTYQVFIDAAKEPPAPPPAAGTAPAQKPAPAPKAAKNQKPEPKLAWDLVESVERIQREFVPRQNLLLSALSADGLSILLKAPNSGPEAVDLLRAAVNKVKESGWAAADVTEEEQGAFRVSVKAPRSSSHSGALVSQVDPSALFAELRKTLAPDEQLEVQFGCLFPNGGGTLDKALLPKEATGTKPEALKLETLKSEARAGYLELWSTQVTEVLHRPAFGKPSWQLTSKGIQISVELLGAPESFWKAADPTIDFNDDKQLNKNAKVSFVKTPDSLCLVRQVDFGEKKLQGKKLFFTAKARKQGVPLETEKIDVQPSSRDEYLIKPAATLKVEDKEGKGFQLKLEVATRAVPSGSVFRVEVFDPGPPPVNPKKPKAPWPVLVLPKTAITYDVPHPKKQVAAGLTDAQGVFRATLKVDDVAAALQDRKQYKVRVIAVQPENKDLNCVTPEALTLPVRLEPPPEGETSETAGTGEGR
ncbi:hypothetical protein [Archangium lansingense]|uniref:Uncharacterized protein n=1 Tax=Archangium lansingense TaxID=2995310 RepID=A0ABT3ZUQ2_9BACT|nr:hypothetical protein [Archangium lansinium]MCY1073143.1 hypothetical protein [Archangium lansinium]